MTKAQLIKEICKREGKKSQVTIGNVREIISILEDICAEDYANATIFYESSFVGRYPTELIEDALRSSIVKKFKKITKRK